MNTLNHFPFRKTLLIGSLALLPLLAKAAGASDEVKQLIQTLQSGSAFEKDVACRRLAQIGDPAAVPALAALLTDEKLSHMARLGLEPIADASADAALRNVLGKVKGRVLVGAIDSLGNRRDAKAVPALEQYLNDSDVEVASAAAFSLGKIGNEAAAKILTANLGKVADDRRPAFGDGAMWCAKRLDLAGNRKEAIGLYETVRKAQLPRFQVAAASRDSVLLQGPAGAKLLGEMLRSDDKEMFNAALLAGREAIGPHVTPVLMDEYHRLSADRRALMLAVLGDRRDPAATPLVLEAAKAGGSTASRVSALKVLGQVGDAGAVPALFAAATDADAAVAKAAQNTLAVLPGKDVDTAVATMLEKGDMKYRRTAIAVATERRLAAANRALIQNINSPDKDVRKASFQALSEIGTAAEVPPLVACLLQATEARDRDIAENTLRDICINMADKSPAAQQLLAALPSAAPAARCAVLRLLSATGGADALAAVRAAARDANAEIQDIGFRALCDWPSADAAPDLLDKARNATKATQKILALRGYIRLISDKDVPVAQKLAMCKEATPLITRTDEKRLLLGSLGTVAHLDALNMANAYLEDKTTAGEASLAVIAIGEQIVGSHPRPVDTAVRQALKATQNKTVQRRGRTVLEQVKK